MPQNNQTLLEKTVADQWQTLPSGLTVIVRPMPGYSSTHVIFATRFGSIDRDFRLDGKEVHLPAGVAHFLEHKMFEDRSPIWKRCSTRWSPLPAKRPSTRSGQS